MVTADNRLAGFLVGKTDPMTTGGGADRALAPADLADLVKRAARTSSYGYGGYRRAKRKVTPRPAQGVIFLVLVTAAEMPDTKRL